MSGTMNPIIRVARLRSVWPAADGWKSRRAAARRTRSRVSLATLPRPVSARDAVATDTPAAWATSVNRGPAPITGRRARTGAARSLDRAHRQAPDEVALDEEREGHDRQGPDHAGRAHRPPVDVDPPDQRRGPDRHRLGCRGRGQYEREQELVVGGDHREDARRDEARRGERQDDPTERAEAGVAVDHRRLLEVDRDLAEEALHHPDDDRHVEGGIHDDQADLRVQEPEPLHDEEQRDDDHDRWQEPDHQQAEPDVAVEPAPEPE